MIINDVIAQLQFLPLNIRKTVHAKVTYTCHFKEIPKGEANLKTLSFEDAGRAIRICLEEFKLKPHANYNKSLANGRPLGYRAVLWGVVGLRQQKRAELAAARLVMNGIYDFAISDRCFTIHIPEECFVSSFYVANPEEWKKRNDHKVRLRKINEVTKKLDREED